MPDALSLSRTELPEEIEKAIERLDEPAKALLSELARIDGVLTCHLAEKVFGPKAPTYRATNRMRTLGRRGLVRRHETNSERWYITEAGRLAIKDA